MIDHMLVRGARAHNLKGIDVDIPLGKIVGEIEKSRKMHHFPGSDY